MENIAVRHRESIWQEKSPNATGDIPSSPTFGIRLQPIHRNL
jgi:hypothetical protein